MSSERAIYAGVKALGINEDTRRDLYERLTGKRSLRAMSDDEKKTVVRELRRLGFRHKSRRLLDGPYAKKLQALWISAWNLGLTRSRDDKALLAFVKRQTGLDHTRWLRDPAQARQVIEALKNWIAREGGVNWMADSPGFLKDHSAKIAWAQWALLHPGSSRLDPGPFRSRVAMILRSAVPLDRLNTSDWHEVCNRLGKEVRASIRRADPC